METRDIPYELLTDGGQHTFEAEFASRPPSIAIVESIAAIEDVKPTDVDFSLYEDVDPEALDTLFANPEEEEDTTDDSEVMAEFQVDGYVVRIWANGKITIKDPDHSE